MKYLSSIVLLLLLFGCDSRQPADKTGLEGESLPAFNIELLDSTHYLNTSQIKRGKPIVLVYMSPHCPYCRAQVKDMLDDMNKMRDFQFCLVTSWPIRDMANFNKEYHLAAYPNIIVGKDTANFVMNHFKTNVVPYTAIYSKDKKLEKSFMGKTFAKQIREVAED